MINLNVYKNNVNSIGILSNEEVGPIVEFYSNADFIQRRLDEYDFGENIQQSQARALIRDLVELQRSMVQANSELEKKLDISQNDSDEIEKLERPNMDVADWKKVLKVNTDGYNGDNEDG